MEEAICTTSFKCGRDVERSHLFPSSDVGREAMTLYGQLQGWLPYNLWELEDVKRYPTNMMLLQHELHTYMDAREPVLSPSLARPSPRCACSTASASPRPHLSNVIAIEPVLSPPPSPTSSQSFPASASRSSSSAMPPSTDRAESYPGESEKVQELCWHDVDVGFEDPASRNQRILVPHHKAGIRLAHMTAQERGAPTIMGETVEQAVKDDEGICPASFEVGRGLDRAHFYAWMDTGRESDTLYAQLQGWISYEKVQAESDKRHARYMVKLQHQLHTYIDAHELFFAPPLGLLWELIADLEEDVADAIEPVANGADAFQMSTTCDARRAVRDFGTLEDPLPAHRFDALAFPTTIPMSFKHDHDGVATKSVAYRTGSATILSSGARQMMEFNPPWPVTYLFLSPSAAAALLLSGARRHKLRLPDEYWQALTYYVEVQSVSSGKTWGDAVLHNRPPSAHSPAPSTKVRKSAERLQGFESHTRKFCRPSDEPDGGKGKRKRGASGSSPSKKQGRSSPSKKQGGSSHGGASGVGGSGSASSSGNITGSSTSKGKGKARQTYHSQQGSVDELKQALDAAIAVYDTSRSRFLNSLAQDFVCCGGRLPVFLLNDGLDAVFNALSEARAQELRALLKTKRDAERALREAFVAYDEAVAASARAQEARPHASTSSSCGSQSRTNSPEESRRSPFVH